MCEHAGHASVTSTPKSASAAYQPTGTAPPHGRGTHHKSAAQGHSADCGGRGIRTPVPGLVTRKAILKPYTGRPLTCTNVLR